MASVGRSLYGNEVLAGCLFSQLALFMAAAAIGSGQSNWYVPAPGGCSLLEIASDNGGSTD